MSSEGFLCGHRVSRKNFASVKPIKIVFMRKYVIEYIGTITGLIILFLAPPPIYAENKGNNKGSSKNPKFQSSDRQRLDNIFVARASCP
jgi:hypothetical protein